CRSASSFYTFTFTDTSTTEIYTLSLHDALPISTFFQRTEQMPVKRTMLADLCLEAVMALIDQCGKPDELRGVKEMGYAKIRYKVRHNTVDRVGVMPVAFLIK